jgi:hypothetical protein
MEKMLQFLPEVVGFEAYWILIQLPHGNATIIIILNLRETGRGGIYWIDLTEDGKYWRALINTVMNLGVS